MTVTIQIPKAIEDSLARGLGSEMGRTAEVGFAVEAYRRGKLTLGQLAQMLGISTYEADGLLKERGVMLDIDVADVQREVQSLRAAVGK